MSSRLKRDFQEVLNRGILRKDEKELEYIEHLQSAKITLQSKVVHQKPDNESQAHKTVIIAQLSQSSDDFNSNHLKVDDQSKRNSSSSACQSSCPNVDFIKKITVTHEKKSKSLDGNHNHKVDHNTQFEMVIGNSERPFETVFNAQVSHGEKASTSQCSYTRPVMPASSCHSLPGRINTTLSSRSSSDKTNGDVRSPPSKKNVWKRFFKSTIKLKSKQLSDRQLDELAIKHLKREPLDAQLPRSMTHKSTSTVSGTGMFAGKFTEPFKSFPIGQQLPPLRKISGKKRHLKILKKILCPGRDDIQGSLHNAGKSQFSTDEDELMKEKSNLVTVEISEENGQNKFLCNPRPQIKELIDDIDTSEASGKRNRSISVSQVEHVIGLKTCRRKSFPNVEMGDNCQCRNKRLDLIADILHMVTNSCGDIVKKQDELGLCCMDSFHFESCEQKPHMDEMADPQSLGASVTGSSRSLTCSTLSLYMQQPCTICKENSADEHLQPQFSDVLPQLLDHLEKNKLICIHEEHVEYFLNATCYDHFEKGLENLIGRDCTMENVALLHYVARQVIKHGGGCCRTTQSGGDGDSESKMENIKSRVMRHTQQFYIENYLPHIQEQFGCLERFILDYSSAKELD